MTACIKNCLVTFRSQRTILVLKSNNVLNLTQISWFCEYFIVWYLLFQAFFRRAVMEKDKYQCAKDKNCKIIDRKRGNCSYCRLQKCLNLGMSRDGTVINICIESYSACKTPHWILRATLATGFLPSYCPNIWLKVQYKKILTSNMCDLMGTFHLAALCTLMVSKMILIQVKYSIVWSWMIE